MIGLLFLLLAIPGISYPLNNEPFSLDELFALPHVTISPRFLKATDSINLAYYPFLPKEEPSSIVILYHGSGLYSNNWYQWIGAGLQQKTEEIGLYCVDMRGHGNSQGNRGDIPTTQQAFDDINTVINHIKKAHPNAKVYLAGHSSGASLILNYSIQADPAIAGYIFLAPYLGPTSGTIRVRDQKEGFIKKVRKWVFVACSFTDDRFFAHIPTIFFNYSKNLLQKDPLIITHHTYALTQALTPVDAKALFTQLKKPFALYIGDQDEQLIPEKIMPYKEYAKNVANTSIARIVPGAKHMSILVEAPALILNALIQFQAH